MASLQSVVGAVRAATTNYYDRAAMRKLRDRDLEDMGLTRSQIPTTWQNELDYMHRVIGPLAMG